MGANIYRPLDFDAITADEVAAQFAAAHAAGANALRAFSWETIFEQPDLLAVALRAARTYGIRVLAELNCKPEKDPRFKTQAGTVAATTAAAKALQHDTDVFFALDLCNEPYFFDVGDISPGSDPNGTTLADLHDFRDHGADNISAWNAWLGVGSCKLAGLDDGALDSPGLPPSASSQLRSACSNMPCCLLERSGAALPS